MKLIIVPLCLNVVLFVGFICAGGLELPQISLEGYDVKLHKRFVNKHQEIIEQGKKIIKTAGTHQWVKKLKKKEKETEEKLGNIPTNNEGEIDLKSFKFHNTQYGDIMMAITAKLDEDDEGKAIIEQDKSSAVYALSKEKVVDVIKYLKRKKFMPAFNKENIKEQLEAFEGYADNLINELDKLQEAINDMWVEEETKNILRPFDRLVSLSGKEVLDTAPMLGGRSLSPSYYLVVLSLSAVLINNLCPRLKQKYEYWKSNYEDWKSRDQTTDPRILPNSTPRGFLYGL